MGKQLCIKWILFLLLAVSTSHCNGVYAQMKASEVQNPKSESLSSWVSNQDNILSPQTVDSLNRMLNRLYDSTSCQISVVAVKGDKMTSARELSMELFDLWHPGMKDKDNGLIILVVTEARQCFFRTGYGIEDIITDAKSTRIFNQTMKPCFINGDWDKGVLQGTVECVNQIYKYYDGGGKNENGGKEIRNMAKGLIACYIIMGCLVFAFAFYQLNNSIKYIEHTFDSKRVNTYRKTFRNYVGIVTLLSVFTLPVFYIIYKRRLKNIRHEKIFCPCGSEMKLLSEKQEDEFLTHTQQLEETLHSRDYDVWLCTSCGRTEIYCYEENSPYEICPVCHAKTYGVIAEQMIHTGILSQHNILRKTYSCKNCHHRDYKDERMQSSAPFIASSMAAGAAGRNSWGGSFGGGFTGGSFGGGFSGGGGGGGSW